MQCLEQTSSPADMHIVDTLRKQASDLGMLYLLDAAHVAEPQKVVASAHRMTDLQLHDDMRGS